MTQDDDDDDNDDIADSREAPMRHLTMWSVYERPSDYPDYFVARLWVILPNGAKPTRHVLQFETLDELRAHLTTRYNDGLVCLPRMDGDDPCIVETWL